jgi:predicted RNase H-like nuclease (RuvC/YqgF family)
MEVIINPSDSPEITKLREELNKYKSIEAELKDVFSIMKTRYKIDFSKNTDWSDLIGDISSLARKIMFSKKEQKEVEALVGRLKNTMSYFATNGATRD